MTTERIETSLRFVGDWPWWLDVGLGLLREGVIALDLPQAGAALADAQSLAAKAKTMQAAPADDWKRLTQDFAAKTGAAREALAKAGGDPARLDALTKELAEPSHEI